MSDMDIDHDPSEVLATVEAGQPENQAEKDELEHLFDMDDDSEFMKEVSNPWMPSSKPSGLGSNADNIAGDIHQQLMLYYRHFFPFKPFFQWLNYDVSTKPSNSFLNREICWTLMDDTFIRFQSYRTLEELKQDMIRLNPAKFDLGAIYNIRPKDRHMVRPAMFNPVSKEMVFDIDMTDYDEIRTCCSGADVCKKCWEFMTVAMKVIDVAMRDDFGFKHLLWVYSGRRGIHCWIADERARKLNNEQRKAIVSYMEVIKGGAQQGKKVKLPNILHPSLARTYDTIQDHFRSIMFESQEILTKPENWEKILSIIPDEDVQSRIRREWESAPNRAPALKWDILRDMIGEEVAEHSGKRQLLENIPRDIMFQYTYPRLDDKVSININHLLKSPFCVHPKTGRVCVPIQIEHCEDFDPMSPPTVPKLVRELNEYDTTHPAPSEGEAKLQDWQKTSLREHVEYFEKFLKGLSREIREKKKDGASSKSLDF
ncbi:MAG: putative DNA primase small subunit [Linnemannia gamsii]|nr:MAG: putative DNA primase small subunit [Linnemannia gamsii]